MANPNPRILWPRLEKEPLKAKEPAITPTREEQIFYAHLYLGLYYDAIGEPDKSADEIALAIKGKINNFMTDVAMVHQRLRAKK